MVPVSSGRATSGARSPTAGIDMAQRVAGDSIDEQQAAPDRHARAGSRDDVRDAARRPEEQGLVVERIDETIRRDSRDVAAEWQQRDGRAGFAGRGRSWHGAPAGSGARISESRARPSSRTADRPARSARASSATFARAWSTRSPPSAPTITRPCAPRARAASTASSRSVWSLSAGDRSIGTPAAASAAMPSSPSESPSPTHRSRVTPSASAWRAPPSAAMTRSTPSSQPGQAVVEIGLWPGRRRRRGSGRPSRHATRPGRC